VRGKVEGEIQRILLNFISSSETTWTSILVQQIKTSKNAEDKPPGLKSKQLIGLLAKMADHFLYQRNVAAWQATKIFHFT
jgi:hypothetical protein